MAKKELRINHDDISDPQTITRVQAEKFKEAGLDMHRHEVDELVDDHKSRVRILKIRNVKFFGPWKHRG